MRHAKVIACIITLGDLWLLIEMRIVWIDSFIFALCLTFYDKVLNLGLRGYIKPRQKKKKSKWFSARACEKMHIDHSKLKIFAFRGIIALFLHLLRISFRFFSVFRWKSENFILCLQNFKMSSSIIASWESYGDLCCSLNHVVALHTCQYMVLCIVWFWK